MRWQRRRLRFTRQGKYFVALTFGIGFAAINTGNNLLHLVLGTMLALIVGSGILSELTLRRLRVERRPPERIFANRPFLVGLLLENGKARIPSLSLEVEDVLAGQPLERKCYFLKVPGGATQTASYRHVFAARGVYKLSEVRLKTRFPFALFEKSCVLAVDTELLAFPEVHPLTNPPAHRPGEGDERHGRAGRRGEMRDLRDYRDGDDPRDVFWRKSARVGRLLVREYDDPRGHELTIFLDNRRLPGLAQAERRRREEEAVSRAASLAAHEIDRGCTVGLASHSVHVAPAGGALQLDRILRALALIEFVGSVHGDGGTNGAIPAGHLVVSPQDAQS